MGNDVILEHYHVPILHFYFCGVTIREIFYTFLYRRFVLLVPLRSFFDHYNIIYNTYILYLSQHRLPPITSNCITCLHVPGYVCCLLINHI